LRRIGNTEITSESEVSEAATLIDTTVPLVRFFVAAVEVVAKTCTALVPPKTRRLSFGKLETLALKSRVGEVEPARLAAATGVIDP
jgi:hypothetical protein